MLQTTSNATLAVTNFAAAKRYARSLAGLPLRAVAVYTALFAMAFWFYSTSWPSAPVLEPDSGSYLRAAQDLSDFHIDQLQERTPGYPLLLLLTHSSRSPNRLLFFIALSLHFASIWLLATVLYRVGLSQTKLALFSLVLLLPPFVEPAGYVLTENLTETTLVAALVSLIFWHFDKKIIWLFISAATIGYAGLTRPTYQVLAFAMVGWVLIAYSLLPGAAVRWRDIVQSSLILVCGSILIVGGYAYYNYQNFGYFGVTFKLGISLSQKTVHVLERLPDEYSPIKEALIRARNADLLESGGASVGYISAAVPELTKLTGFDVAQLSNYMVKLNLLLIQKAPLQYLREVVWAFGSYCFPSSTGLANFNSRVVQLLWAALHFTLLAAFAYTLAVLFGGVIYLRKCQRFLNRNNIPASERRSINFIAFAYGLAGTIVIYTAAISCVIDAGDPRHRVPTDAIIVFMVFLGAHFWRQLIDISRILFALRSETR